MEKFILFTAISFTISFWVWGLEFSVYLLCTHNSFLVCIWKILKRFFKNRDSLLSLSRHQLRCEKCWTSNLKVFKGKINNISDSLSKWIYLHTGYIHICMYIDSSNCRLHQMKREYKNGASNSNLGAPFLYLRFIWCSLQLLLYINIYIYISYV